MTRTEMLYNLPTGQIRPGDIVHAHGMKVRIDRIRPYHPAGRGCLDSAEDSHRGACDLAWACSGTVLNPREAVGEHGIPRSFLYDDDRLLRGPGHGREDHWNVQGNNLARWAVERPARTTQDEEARP